MTDRISPVCLQNPDGIHRWMASVDVQERQYYVVGEIERTDEVGKEIYSVGHPGNVPAPDKFLPDQQDNAIMVFLVEEDSCETMTVQNFCLYCAHCGQEYQDHNLDYEWI